ncbi:MAG: methylisocitrate lyase [Deltaproteobacteria bacterium]|nr:methylisocitrate lyase [Deltaproteobacteria bacterium]
MPGRLKGLIKDKTIAVPGAFDAVSAMMIERAGFPALYISGAGLSNSSGLPDTGSLGLDEAARLSSYIIRSVNIPAIVDCDTGFGGPEAVKEAVREFGSLGAEAVQLEDQRLPKRCGHLPGKELISADEFAEKIAAAASSRRDKTFLIIARTDGAAVEGLGGAIDRARKYLDAGADIIFPEALTSREDFMAFSREIRAPLIANMTEFGKTPYLSVDDFSEMGYSMVLFPMTIFRVAMKAIGSALTELREKGTQKGLLDKMQTRKELYGLLGYKGF